MINNTSQLKSFENVLVAQLTLTVSRCTALFRRRECLGFIGFNSYIKQDMKL